MTVLCINANAAVDKTLVIEHFRLSAIHRPQDQLVLPGGKGANVARALTAFQEPVILAGWVGGFAGRFIEEKLREEGIRTAFVQTACESRECISILDPTEGMLTEIYEKGAAVTGDQVAEFERCYRQLLDSTELVIISGSLPPGVPSDFYSTLIRIAKARRIPALLDTSGEVLRDSFFQAEPDLIKPNRSELQVLQPGQYTTLPDIAGAAGRLADSVGSRVAVSLGADGMVYAQAGGDIWLAMPPQVKAISAVGSGDCLLAGLAIGTVHGWAIEDTLSLAIAMGAANALLLGAGRFRISDVDTLRPQVRVQKLSGRT